MGQGSRNEYFERNLRGARPKTATKKGPSEIGSHRSKRLYGLRGVYSLLPGGLH